MNDETQEAVVDKDDVPNVLLWCKGKNSLLQNTAQLPLEGVCQSFGKDLKGIQRLPIQV